MSPERGGPPVMEMHQPPVPEAAEMQPGPTESALFNHFADMPTEMFGQVGRLGDLLDMCPVKGDASRVTADKLHNIALKEATAKGYDIPEHLLVPPSAQKEQEGPSTAEALFRSKPAKEPEQSKPKSAAAAAPIKETVAAKPVEKTEAPVATTEEAPATPQPEAAVQEVPAQRIEQQPEVPVAAEPKPPSVEHQQPVAVVIAPAEAAPAQLVTVPIEATQQPHLPQPEQMQRPAAAEQVIQPEAAAQPEVRTEPTTPIPEFSAVQQLPEMPPAPEFLPLPDVHPVTAADVLPFAFEAQQQPAAELTLGEPSLPASFAEAFEQPDTPSVAAIIQEAPLPPSLLATAAYEDLGWQSPTAVTLPPQPATETISESIVEPTTEYDTPVEQAPQPVILPTVESFAESLLIAAPPTAEGYAAAEPSAEQPVTMPLPAAVAPAFQPMSSFTEALVTVESPTTVPVSPHAEYAPALERPQLLPPPQEVAARLVSLKPAEKMIITPFLEAFAATVTVAQEQAATGIEPSPATVQEITEMTYRLFEALQVCAEPQRVEAFVQTLLQPQFLRALETATELRDQEGTHERKFSFLPLSTLVSMAFDEIQAALGSFVLQTARPGVTTTK
ncbi:MAG TPA: hypothetical protein VD735_05540 [Candidatus Saccharimonadales bacterium]|nr:hypothetical protein [Candidatus Saccharimonadales bacterium]